MANGIPSGIQNLPTVPVQVVDISWTSEVRSQKITWDSTWATSKNLGNIILRSTLGPNFPKADMDFLGHLMGRQGR